MSTRADTARKRIIEPAEMGTGPLSIEPYLSPEFYQLERERLFRRTWLCIGRQEEIPQPGDYFVKELAVCDASILVSRGRDGVIRAFHNVCTHRCNKLVWERCGTSQGWACQFHGWAFDSKGELRGVPDEKNFRGLDKSQHGLVPVSLDTWCGFIFINLDPRPQETLTEFLAELGEQHKDYDFAEKSFCVTYQWELNANWKVPIETSNELYHLTILHRNTTGANFGSKTNPFGHPVDMKMWQRHRYFAVGVNPEMVPKPVGLTAYLQSGATPPGQPTPGLNPGKAPTWAVDIPTLFPNGFFAIRPDEYLFVSCWPLAVDRSLLEVRVYMKPPKTPGQAFAQELAKCVNRDVGIEDAVTFESVYAGMKSRAVPHVVFQDGEVLLRHFYEAVQEHVR